MRQDSDSHKWWIKSLHLYQADQINIETGKELSDTVVNAAQSILSHQYLHISGFQNTLSGQTLKFRSVSNDTPSVQILRTEIQMLSVQQQKGAFDCALFAIANATEVCEGNNPEHVKYDQTKMRDHLLNCFGSRKLTTFPKMIEQEILPRPTRVYHKIEVFCYCRMPEEYDYLMILCDYCLKWYHYTCVNIDQNNIPLD